MSSKTLIVHPRPRHSLGYIRHTVTSGIHRRPTHARSLSADSVLPLSHIHTHTHVDSPERDLRVREKGWVELNFIKHPRGSGDEAQKTEKLC